MIYANIIDDIVVATTINKPKDMNGWVSVQGTLPPRPTVEEGEPDPRLMLADGKLVWQTGKTQEELSESRRMAYEAEADRYLIAMHGYEVEGKADEAENCRKAYLAKKAEIRKRFVSEL